MATMQRMLLVTAALFFVAVPGTAGAKELGGVSLPDQAEVSGKPLVLNGMGIREATFMNVRVYVAGLYLETKSNNAERVIQSAQVKRLTLRFVREVTRDQVVDAWQSGFEKNAGKDLAAIGPRIKKLNGWMIDFRPRDVLSFTYVPGTGVTVEVNGKAKGTIEGDDFARGLFSIWFGPEPPNASLKAGLLGKS